MHMFTTDQDFYQAAFNFVAMCISEYAAESISGGCEADVGEESLVYLADACAYKGLSPAKINVYLQIIADENELIRQLDQF